MMLVKHKFLFLFALCLVLMTVSTTKLVFAEDERGVPIKAGVHRGELTKGDNKMDSGEFYDLFEYSGTKGEKVRITLKSDDFDTYLIIISPEGKQFDNDDIVPGTNTNSQLEFTFDKSGVLKIGVTTKKAGNKGKYTLEIKILEKPAEITEKPDEPESKPEKTEDETQKENPPGGIYYPEALNWELGDALKDNEVKNSRLTSRSKKRNDNKFYDAYHFKATKGDYVFMHLSSREFDTYLMLVTPDGMLYENDDIQERVNTNSRIAMHIMKDGICRVIVTSTYSNRRGKYTLRFLRQEITIPQGIPKILPGVIKSELTSQDCKIEPEKYVSWFSFDGSKGERVFLQLSSSHFDTVLIVLSPSGHRYKNDDIIRGVNTNSRLEFTLLETGIYYIAVTSCYEQSTGLFSLIFDTGIQLTGSRQTQPEIKPLQEGKITSELTIKDSKYQQRFAEFYNFEAKVGQYVSLNVRSDYFETLLVLRTPSGEIVRSNEFSFTHHKSEISKRVLETGSYTLIVTSETIGNLGQFELQFSLQNLSENLDILAEGQYEKTLIAGSEKYLGRYINWFAIKVEKDDAITVEMRSTELDPYLILVTPDGFILENDDFQPGDSTARISIRIESSGTCILGAFSYRQNDTGKYTLNFIKGELIYPRLNIGITQSELNNKDLMTKDKRYADFYQFFGTKGGTAKLQMLSTEVDSYLIVSFPSGKEISNDDISLSNKDSELIFELEETGIYRVTATTIKNAYEGKYTLIFRLSGFEIGELVEGTPIKGELTEQSIKYEADTFINWYLLDGMHNRQAEIRLSSGDFDAFLVLVTPKGEKIENNNISPDTTDAAIRFRMTEGAYQVGVTTFQKNELGKYELNLIIHQTVFDSKEKTIIKINSEVTGELTNDDLVTEDGRRYDEYLLAIEKDGMIQIDVESTQFDTQLIVIAPDSRMLRNDDISQTNRNSRLIIKCDFKGELLIIVLPYSAREKGKYKLSVKKLDEVPLNATVENLHGMSAKNPKFYGIFIGISDYSSIVNDLRFCKDDAIKLAKTFEQLRLMNSQDYILLTDKQATTSNIEQAFERMSKKVTKDDVFIFFYSGHGIQGPYDEKATDEVDRRHEYLYVVDGTIKDNTLGTYFDKIKSKLTVITIDCCFAGGFRRNLITQPNRVGFFSSEEDLTSAVASKFSAGGFLSFFFRKAIEGGADLNNDNIITIGELSHYLQRRYALEVGSQYAETSEGARSYQHIVVDRGGVRINTPFIYR